MLSRRNCRYDKEGRLIKDKYYFYNFLVFKYILSYPKVKGNVTATLYLFGFLPIKKFYITTEMLLSKSIRGGVQTISLDASHSMALDIAQALNESGIEYKIQRLCAGLDSQSIKCVNTILARLKSIVNINDKKIALLTQEEIQTLQTINSEFYSRIICFENSYFYNGFFLPKSAHTQFVISVFLA